MGSSAIIQEAFAMLSDMTTANGYSRDYTPVKSVYNSSATMKQTPYISVHTEPEEQYDGATGFNEIRSILPIVVTARVRPVLVESGGARKLHKDRSEIEFAEDIARGEVRTDIKKRFQPVSYMDFASCISITAGEEIDPEENGLSDSNKHDMFVQYRFYITYKENL